VERGRDVVAVAADPVLRGMTDQEIYSPGPASSIDASSPRT